MTICTAPDKAAATAITQPRERTDRRSVGSVGHASPPAHSRAVLAITLAAYFMILEPHLALVAHVARALTGSAALLAVALVVTVALVVPGELRGLRSRPLGAIP